jgi:hypothetical protein
MRMRVYFHHNGTQIFSDVLGCRESLLGDIDNYCSNINNCVITINPDYLNSTLLKYVATCCKAGKVLCKQFKITPEGFSFVTNKPKRNYFHFISFLCLLNDQGFSNITLTTKCKDSEKIRNKTRKEIAKDICDVITSYRALRNFDSGNSMSVCGYINIVVGENKIIRANQYCNGPRSAYDYREH